VQGSDNSKLKRTVRAFRTRTKRRCCGLLVRCRRWGRKIDNWRLSFLKALPVRFEVLALGDEIGKLEMDETLYV
jgi:hypothetical protein